MSRIICEAQGARNGQGWGGFCLSVCHAEYLTHNLIGEEKPLKVFNPGKYHGLTYVL